MKGEIEMGGGGERERATETEQGEERDRAIS